MIRNKFCLIVIVTCLMAFGAGAGAKGMQGMQGSQGMGGMKMMNMNDIPYAKVKAMLSNPAMAMKAMRMAKKNNVILMAGMAVQGKGVTWKGELTGANCYLSSGMHGHNHALCSKACVVAGTPILFLHDGKTYLVLTAKDGMPLPEAAYDDLGQPGVTISGVTLKSHGVNAIAIQTVSSGAMSAGKGMNRMDMNNMPYSKVKAMLANPSMAMKAMRMAKKNNVILMGGMAVQGKGVTWKGELTGANCYLSVGMHGHNHALCSKACVVAGTPILFLHDGKTYIVLTAKDGMPLPEAAYDDLGAPNVKVKGEMLKSHGMNAIAIQSVSR